MTSWRKNIFEVCEKAGKILLKYYQKKIKISVKENAGIVTEADKASEDLIIKTLRKKYPGSSFLAEESGSTKMGGDLLWVIDPLDGTTNYAHGFPFFCISIAVHENKIPIAGAVYHPLNGEFYYAEKGKGAYLGKKRIQVSTTATFPEALFGTGFYYTKGESLRSEVEIFRRISELALGVRRPGAAALDLAFLACGKYDGFWEKGLSPWDVAAGFLLVQEAGGILTNYSGSQTDIYGGEVVGSNGILHSELIRHTSLK